MNEHAFSVPADDLPFDRLIDGELSSREYRELLAALEASPDGWRRCALAFLEAQALDAEVGSMREDLEARVGPLVKPVATAQSPIPWMVVLTIAAGLLVAVGLGYSLRGWLAPRASGSSELVQVEEPAVPQSQVPRTKVESQSKPLGDLTLVVDNGNARGEEIRVPVFAAKDAAERLSFEPSGLPPDVRQALERTGHHIEEQRQFVPVDLRDGRQVVLPVEQFRITPAVRRSY